MNVEIKVNLHDVWIGAYWTLSKSVESPYRDLKVYVCLIPCLPIRFRFEWGWQDTPENMAFREKQALHHDHMERVAHEIRTTKERIV